MADELREWKPRNRLANALAGGLKSVNAFAAKPFGFENPPGEMLVNALALPQIASTLERYSYGQPLTNAGKANVPMLPSDTADALMAAAPVVAKWPRQAAGAALGLMGAADTGALSKAATVWHATPHKFDKFDASRIGSGEGAQVYGKGLYLADSEQVSGMGGAYFNQFKDHPAAASNGGPFALKVELQDDHISHMLDWDKPLKEQPKAVQEALRDVTPVTDPFDFFGSSEPIGRDYYLALSHDGGAGLHMGGNAALGDTNASSSLRARGVFGVRYLDEVSRGTGTGSSNYVVFPGNENMLTILERNGQPINKLAK